MTTSSQVRDLVRRHVPCDSQLALSCGLVVLHRRLLLPCHNTAGGLAAALW